ncbi:Hypothetical Protein RradSPS_0538 [Rubrobacter radiotolerans]|nr:Hypothetical Protein RradSPS_0538 [Rubrobacter radiotolerans]
MRRLASGSSGPLRLVEQGSARGRSERGATLVRVHNHLRYFLFLEGPEVDARTRGELRRAQALIERSLGFIPLPPEGHPPSDRARGHLASAKAICDEHLGGAPFPLSLGREARVLRLVSRGYARECVAPRPDRASLP